ncbi:MAG: hypothetical protein K8R88_13740 [Armatimonadetes bacterium]|nr:hypothetical protein [Armatimonadota bacterium]
MKFGVSRTEITPPFPMLMGGYGLLDPFDGVHDSLTLTAVYFNDGTKESWIVSADICQFPDKEHIEHALDILSSRLHCSRDAIFLNASHTHGGPLACTTRNIDDPDSLYACVGENLHDVLRYFEFLWSQAGDAMDSARQSAFCGSLHYGEAKTNFPINRRKLINGRVEMEPDPEGVIDDRLRLLVVRDDQGAIKILLPILACHPTSLGAQHRISADYVGTWRDQVESFMNGESPMAFLQACAGDARPAQTRDGEHFRRVSFDELEVMGSQLLDETRSALEGMLRDLGPLSLAFGSRTISVPCTHTEDYKALLASDRPTVVKYAEECLRRLGRGEIIPDHASLRLHYFQLTENFAFLGMDCEPVCGLGFSIEKALAPQQALALGYTNGCFGYVPDETELRRGGYEAESYLYEVFSGPFEPGLEKRIADAFVTLRQDTLNA